LVLVSRGAFQILGNLSSRFRHSFGDLEYGYRAQRAGIPVVIAPGYLAECRTNPLPRWQRADVPLRERLRHLHSNKGCPPAEAAVLFRVAYGWIWPLWVARIYWRVLFPSRKRFSA